MSKTTLDQVKTLLSGVGAKTKEVGKRIPVKLSQLENDLEHINPDWNQIDETRADYIKNRPCYVAVKSREEQLFDTHCVLTKPSAQQISYGGEISDPDDSIVFKEGSLYNVYFEGVLYENLTCFRDSSRNNLLTIGESYNSMLGTWGKNDYSYMKYPFALIEHYGVGNAIVVIRTLGNFYNGSAVRVILSEVIPEEVQTLPEKYLPESVIKHVVLNVSSSTDTNGNVTYSGDKTFDEITAALVNGYDVVAYYDGYKYEFHGDRDTDWSKHSKIVFGRCDISIASGDSNDAMIKPIEIGLFRDNSVHISDEGFSKLNTTDKSIIGAINEVNEKVDTVNDAIGTDELNTTDKTIIGAINEVIEKATPFIINVTGSATENNTSAYVLDKTFEEIKQAYDDGRELKCRLHCDALLGGEDGEIIPGDGITLDLIGFCDDAFFFDKDIDGVTYKLCTFNGGTEFGAVLSYLHATFDGPRRYTPTRDYHPATKKYVDDSRIQPDWNEKDETAPGYIANKPEIPTDLVQYAEQTLTDEQQVQVRTNIGAASQTEVDRLSEEIADLIAKDEKIVIGKNKLNLDALISNMYLWPDGSMTERTTTGRFVTDYIEVTPGKIVTLSYIKDGVVKTDSLYNAICLYDSDKNVVNGGNHNQATFTVPSGVAYVRLTISSYMASSGYKPQIELTEDGVPTSYEPYIETIVNENDELLESAIIKEVHTSIPKVIHIVVGKEFRMYYKNVMSRYTDRLWFGNAGGITVKRYSEYLSIVATEETTKSISWKVYDDAFNVLDSGTIQVIVTAEKKQDAKILVIGDSTVTQSNAISQKLLDCFSANGGTLTLLGTRGTTPALHEGRAGWSAKDYCTKESGGSYTNPFYNNGFDFSHYMTTQGYSGVDVVVIQLGINDIFSMTYENFTDLATLEYIQKMVSSIVGYNSAIKVIVNLLSVPNGNGTSFADAYGTSQIDFVNLVNSIRMSKALIEKFSGNAYVTISPNNCVLDATTDINDGVHPNSVGYAKLGQAIYETINGIFDGSQSGGDEPITSELWNVGSRTAVVKSYANVNDSRTISNNHYYYPCGYTGAWVDTVEVSDVEVGTNSLQFKSGSSAYGVFVPFVGLDTSKTYRFTVNPTVGGFRIYLVNYSSTGAYVGNEIVVDKTTGLTTFEFVPNADYQQGFCFACLSGTKNIIGIFTDLSLVEVTE